MAEKNPLCLASNKTLSLLKSCVSQIASLIWRLAATSSPLYLIGLIFLAGCNSKLDSNQYIKWVRDTENQLHVKTSASNFVFDVQYQPADYILLQRAGGQIDKNRYASLREEVQSIQYYTLTISVADEKTDFIDFNVHDLSEKQRKLYYFSYEFQNDIQVMEDGKLLPCVLFHFERPVDLKPARTFVLGFENLNPQSKESTLQISSRYLGGEPVKIKIVKENIPTLEL